MDGEERKKMLAQLLEQTDINNSKAILTMIKCFGNTKGRGNGEGNSDGVGFLIDRKVWIKI